MIENKIFERKINIFAPLILYWGQKFYRKYPWREELENPYKIICTEILLQKTSAEIVLSIYDDFFENFPNEKVLSNSEVEDVIDIVRPTGLYNKKSKSLIETAKWMCKNGITAENLQKLKEEVSGVSNYATNAVLCFCFNKKVNLIDVNVKKIVGLFFNAISDVEVDLILSKATEKIHGKDLKNFYFGLIDLSASMRAENRNPFEEEVAIVTINDLSFNKLIEQHIYWRVFPMKRKVLMLAFYRKAPVKSITHLGIVKETRKKEWVTNYVLELLFEILPHIDLQKGENPAVSYKYSTLNKIFNANSYSEA